MFISKTVLTDLISFCILLVVGVILNHQTTQIADLQLGDEALYAYKGVTWFKTGFEADWGPIYSVWYWFLGNFSSNSIELYYLNMVLLSSIPTLLMYVFFRKVGIAWWFALYCCLAFHFSALNFPEGVKVSMFSLVLLMAFCIAAYHFFDDKPLYFWVTIIVGLLVTSYVRPEYFLVFMLSLVCLSVYVLVARQKKGALLGLVSLTVLVFWLVGLPISGRGQVAFLQGIAYNYVQHHGQADTRLKNLNVWMDYLPITQLIFGQKVANAKEAFLTSPTIVWQYHLWPNIQDFIIHIKEIIGYYISFLIPEKLFSLASLKLKIFWAVLLGIIPFLVSFQASFLALKIGLSKPNKSLILCLLLIIAPSFSSIYSVGATRYLVPFYIIIPMIFFGISQILVLKNIPATSTLPRPIWILMPLFTLLISVSIYQQSIAQKPKKSSDASKARFAQSLVDTLGNKDGIVLLSNDDQLVTQIDCQNVPYLKYKKHTDFEKFISKNKVNLLIFSSSEAQYYADDASVTHFLDNPPSSFIKMPIPQQGDIAFVIVQKQ
jgi:hypothetical protein